MLVVAIPLKNNILDALCFTLSLHADFDHVMH